MDYKYIKQLLERYWECQTTLEEEAILRAFFSQEDIPASLLPYRDLFIYERIEPMQDVLGSDFDAKMLALISQEKPVKARVISYTQRLRPLFRAVAVVAVILTLANAMQVPFNNKADYNSTAGTEMHSPNGVNMAKGDTAVVDTVHRSGLSKQEMPVEEKIDNIDNQAFKIK
jgi:hypothetical protein